MEERQSRLSSTVWRRFQQYFCVRLIPQNSMFSNFCHVLNILLYLVFQIFIVLSYTFFVFESTIHHVSVCTLPMWASHRRKVRCLPCPCNHNGKTCGFSVLRSFGVFHISHPPCRLKLRSRSFLLP